MYPTNVESFSSGYDLVDLTVHPTRDSTPKIQRRMCEDLRYWADGTAEPFDDEKVYLKLPGATGHIRATPVDDIEFGVIEIPDGVLHELEIEAVPTVQEFLVANPSHTQQLKRFEQR